MNQGLTGHLGSTKRTSKPGCKTPANIAASRAAVLYEGPLARAERLARARDSSLGFVPAVPPEPVVPDVPPVVPAVLMSLFLQPRSN
jgi:hypothetical protein